MEKKIVESGYYMSVIIEIPTPKDMHILNKTIHIRKVYVTEKIEWLNEKIRQLEKKYGNKFTIEREESLTEAIKLIYD